MLSLDYYLHSLLLVSILRGVSCENLTALQREEFSPEGSSVTLSYRYSKTITGRDYCFWYRQYPGEPPELIIYHLGNGNIMNNQIPGLNITVESNQINLSLSSAAVTDSAVFYCAVRPATGGRKILFGRGSRVTVETKELYKPSYYKLQDETTSLCLATGFSRIRGADEDKKHIFNNRTGAVRIEGDSLFNQVGYLPSGGSDVQTCGTEGGPVDCDESLQPDPQVNLVSLTVLGLRLLFMKTVVFNVLLTLRLWITS